MGKQGGKIRRENKEGKQGGKTTRGNKEGKQISHRENHQQDEIREGKSVAHRINVRTKGVNMM